MDHFWGLYIIIFCKNKNIDSNFNIWLKNGIYTLLPMEGYTNEQSCQKYMKNFRELDCLSAQRLHHIHLIWSMTMVLVLAPHVTTLEHYQPIAESLKYWLDGVFFLFGCLSRIKAITFWLSGNIHNPFKKLVIARDNFSL